MRSVKSLILLYMQNDNWDIYDIIWRGFIIRIVHDFLFIPMCYCNFLLSAAPFCRLLREYVQHNLFSQSHQPQICLQDNTTNELEP